MLHFQKLGRSYVNFGHVCIFGCGSGLSGRPSLPTTSISDLSDILHFFSSCPHPPPRRVLVCRRCEHLRVLRRVVTFGMAPRGASAGHATNASADSANAAATKTGAWHDAGSLCAVRNSIAERHIPARQHVCGDQHQSGRAVEKAISPRLTPDHLHPSIPSVSGSVACLCA
eukprot:3535285-Rhodomonas_salina.2